MKNMLIYLTNKTYLLFSIVFVLLFVVALFFIPGSLFLKTNIKIQIKAKPTLVETNSYNKSPPLVLDVKSRINNTLTKIAIHEAGHALISLYYDDLLYGIDIYDMKLELRVQLKNNKWSKLMWKGIVRLDYNPKWFSSNTELSKYLKQTEGMLMINQAGWIITEMFFAQSGDGIKYEITNTDKNNYDQNLKQLKAVLKQQNQENLLLPNSRYAFTPEEIKTKVKKIINQPRNLKIILLLAKAFLTSKKLSNDYLNEKIVTNPENDKPLTLSTLSKEEIRYIWKNEELPKTVQARIDANNIRFNRDFFNNAIKTKLTQNKIAEAKKIAQTAASNAWTFLKTKDRLKNLKQYEISKIEKVTLLPAFQNVATSTTYENLTEVQKTIIYDLSQITNYQKKINDAIQNSQKRIVVNAMLIFLQTNNRLKQLQAKQTLKISKFDFSVLIKIKPNTKYETLTDEQTTALYNLIQLEDLSQLDNNQNKIKKTIANPPQPQTEDSDNLLWLWITLPLGFVFLIFVLGSYFYRFKKLSIAKLKKPKK